MELKRFGIAIIVAHALAITAWGHHSHGNYQMSEWVEFDGTVMDVYWINPHAWVYMDVESESGETETWALEAAGAATLARAGISPDELQPGDKIHVNCHALRDGSNGCLLGFITTSDGVEKMWD